MSLLAFCQNLIAPGREGIGVLALGVSLFLRRPAYSDVLSPRRVAFSRTGGVLPDTAGAASDVFYRRKRAPGFVEPCKCSLHGRGEGNYDLFHVQTVSAAASPRMRHVKGSLTHVPSRWVTK